MKHTVIVTIPPEYRSLLLCASSVPVRGVLKDSIGTEMVRLYITTGR
jgi:hypothetical protein